MIHLRILVLFLLLSTNAAAKDINNLSFYIGSESLLVDRFVGRVNYADSKKDLFLKRAVDNLLTGVLLPINSDNAISIGTTFLINHGYQALYINKVVNIKEREVQINHYYSLPYNLFLTNTLSYNNIRFKSSGIKNVEIYYTYSLGLEKNITEKISIGGWFSPKDFSTSENSSNSVGAGIYYIF